MDKLPKFGERWGLFPVPARQCVYQAQNSPPSSPFLHVHTRALLRKPGFYLFIALYVHRSILAVERN